MTALGTNLKGMDSGSRFVKISRHRKHFVVGDEYGEFARAETVDMTLRYVADLLHGPPTGVEEVMPRGACETGKPDCECSLCRARMDVRLKRRLAKDEVESFRPALDRMAREIDRFRPDLEELARDD